MNINQARRWFDTRIAAEYCDRSYSTLTKLRMVGGGPVYCKIGGRVSYCVDDLDAWMDAARRASVSTPAPQETTSPAAT